jgi:hypothetical protein
MINFRKKNKTKPILFLFFKFILKKKSEIKYMAIDGWKRPGVAVASGHPNKTRVT